MFSNQKESSNSNPNFIPAIEGWCFKQGTFFKTWKKRWFVLKDTTITYFTSPDGKAKGTISLTNTKVELDPNQKKKNAFMITSPKKVYHITASTEEDTKYWIDAIMIANGQKKPKIGIDSFEILKVLGRGSCGKVQLVRFKENNQLYALKSLSKAKLEEINQVCQTITEKDALLSFNHPFIVSARFTFQTDTKVFMVLDYAAGGELLKQLETEYDNHVQTNSYIMETDRRNHSKYESSSFDESEESDDRTEKAEIINRPITFNSNIGIHNCLPISTFDNNNFGGFSLDKVRIYAAEIALAIKYLHSIGIIHRDIKLSNILLDKDGHIKLTDFGLAKEKMYGKCAQTSTFCGTPLYAAPEIILRKPYGRSVDWWSFGIIVYELIFYDSPFYSENINHLCQQIIGKELKFPSKFVIEGQKFADSDKNNQKQDPGRKKMIPFVIYDFLTKLLQKNPLRRLGTNNEDEIFNHPFFEEISFHDLMEKNIEMPWKPKLKNEDDVSFFYEQYTGEDAYISVEDPTLITQETNDAFANFSYFNENNALDCL